MQENRSFDNCFGTLQGVRGFNDPRAITKPDNDLVWIQKDEQGRAFIPFRLNIKDTTATWLGSLPHSWSDQVDAGNGGRHDQWLKAKKSGHEGFENVPLTLGYYDRRDIPFYYALADAFTVCDQNFCSSLTGTTPNRLYLWTGTIRDKHDANGLAHVSNADVDYEKEVNWKTFPERLEENDISWKIYQNEISLESGLDGDEDGWLANFTDNPIEWFSQYHVRFAPSYRNYLERMKKELPVVIDELENKLQALDPASKEAEEVTEQLKSKLALMLKVVERHQWSEANFLKLTKQQQNLHTKAFTTNRNDPHYRELETITYDDNGTTREMKVPKGDILHQFREDVSNGNLPTVSWVVGPANFSDHPGAPWYGAWYVSEVLDILTNKPDVWRKTIFILCYDENDGYFDHVPSFLAPDPADPGSGKVTEGIDPAVEFVSLEDDLHRTDEKHARQSSIGLGYRVPLVVASPWSRGGAVCSEVFDHTSVLQFLEHFLSHKTGRQIIESNISTWRRTVCGDLTSIFKPYHGEKIGLPPPLKKKETYETIHRAQFKKDPSGYHELTGSEIAQLNKMPSDLAFMPQQEKGIRSACPLSYELYADGHLSADKKSFDIFLKAGNEFFADRSCGAPFRLYNGMAEQLNVRHYAVAAGKNLNDSLPLTLSGDANYHVTIHGPNGFYREFEGDKNDPYLDISLAYAKNRGNTPVPNGNLELRIRNRNNRDSLQLKLEHHGYRKSPETISIKAGAGDKSETIIIINLAKSFGWYDFSLSIEGKNNFYRRYAGHAETGNWSKTDPVMGRAL
jgi:phospholipase C